MLGVPAYGHSFTVSSSNAVDSSGNLASNPPFTKNPATSSVDQCGNPEAESDIMNFATLVSDGILNDDGTPASGMKYRFDNCSQTVSIDPFSSPDLISHASSALRLRRVQAIDGFLR